jgi:hypothetical protein
MFRERLAERKNTIQGTLTPYPAWSYASLTTF